MHNKVVVTGIGVVSPNGTGRAEFQNAIYEGKSGIRYLEILEKHGFGCHIGGCPDISESAFIKYLDRHSISEASDVIKYGVLAGIEAWTDAGFTLSEEMNEEPDHASGCIIGTGIGTSDIFGNRIIPFTNENNTKRLRSTIVEQSMLSGTSAALSGLLGLGNQCYSNSSACSTGTEAIVNAYERIRSGLALRMLAGGSDACCIYGWAGFDSMRVLTRKHNQEPEKGSRPMSASASGFVPGAGAGVLLLESLASALKRGAHIYCEISGADVNCGAQRQGGSMTAPNARSVKRCIQSACEKAGVLPNKIDYISGHLSSTMADPIEIANWAEATGLSGKMFPYINSTKSLTGHCIGAAGAIETIASILQMENNFIHPSLNCEDLHPEIEKLVSPQKIPFTRIDDVDLQVVAKASFGFGDVNSCLILQKL